MAVIMEFESDFSQMKILNNLRDQFPAFRASALGYVGSKAKEKLRKSFLSGQELTLQSSAADPLDKRNRRLVSYSVGRNATHVKVSSYPVNLFERGRTLRSGAKEPGRKIITGKLKAAVMADLQNMLNQFDNKILQKEFDKL
jgi:hypothetical protein